MRTVIVFVALVVIASITLAQQDLPVYPKLERPVLSSSVSAQPQSERPTRYRIPGKRASQYTPEDWGALIDSTWGPGQSAAAQLQVFDAFWNAIDRQWGGFPNLPANLWDSLRSVYRPQIGAGLSRGRFYALMSRMRLGLMELHTRVIDWRVDTTFGWEWNGDSTFHYRPGVPLLITGTSQGNIFGAAVTPLPDSTNLVYRAAPDNPLGLVPGDLVLGYEGVQWKRLYRQLLDAGLPVTYFDSWSGTSPESQTHFYLMAVGHNWGLFDTIDVVKYSTGDTLHLPTALLDTTVQRVWESDQVPVPGVPMPQKPASPPYVGVSWGVIQGENIGYIYVWDWASTQTSQLFGNAVNDLIDIRRVEGLVIDFRMNWGGDPTNANYGFRQLFNIDPSTNFYWASRTDPNNHMGFTLTASTSWRFSPAPKPYDRPIAVLIGPNCFSGGDENVSRIRFHPMARLFGRPTDGAFASGTFIGVDLPDVWRYRFYTGTVYSTVPGEGYLMHKGVHPDEEVWLTRDGVANGVDDVVKRALVWMDSLAYAHGVLVENDTVRNGIDSVHITAKVENPADHTLVVSAIVTNTLGAQIDSVRIMNTPGDTLWRAHIGTPEINGRYNVSVRTEDVTAASYRRLPNVAWFTVIPTVSVSVAQSWNLISVPLMVGDFLRTAVFPSSISQASAYQPGIGYVPADTLANGTGYWLKFPAAALVPMNGIPLNADTIPVLAGWNLIGSITAPLSVASVGSIPGGIVLSPFYTYGTTGYEQAGTIAPGKGYWVRAGQPGFLVLSSSPLAMARIKIVPTDEMPPAPPDEVTAESEVEKPREFALAQNYPNPFNPTTIIEFRIQNSELTILKVFDLLGREIATLINEVKQPGSYTVQWDASGVSSGVYFYRLRAGDFVQTKRMLVVR
jgi:hypothetical protein